MFHGHDQILMGERGEAVLPPELQDTAFQLRCPLHCLDSAWERGPALQGSLNPTLLTPLKEQLRGSGHQLF